MFFKRKKFYTLLDIKNQIVYTPLIFVLLTGFLSSIVLYVFLSYQKKNKIELLSQSESFYSKEALKDYIGDIKYNASANLDDVEIDLSNAIYEINGYIKANELKKEKIDMNNLKEFIHKLKLNTEIKFVIFDSNTYNVLYGEDLIEYLRSLTSSKIKTDKFRISMLKNIQYIGNDNIMYWVDSEERDFRLSYFKDISSQNIFIGAFSKVDDMKALTKKAILDSIELKSKTIYHGHLVFYDQNKKVIYNYNEEGKSKEISSINNLMHINENNLVFTFSKYQYKIYLISSYLDNEIRKIEEEFKHKLLVGIFIIALSVLFLIATSTVFARFINSIFNKYNQRLERRNTLYKKWKDRYELAIIASNDGLWDLNLETKEIFFSNKWLEIFKYNRKDISTFDEWKELIHPEDKDIVLQRFDNLVENKSEHFICEYRLKDKRGNYKWLLVRGKAFQTRNTKRVLMMSMDIDNRMKLTKELKNVELLTEVGRIVIFRWKHDEKLSVKFVSNSIEAYGYNASDFLDENIEYLDFIYKEDREDVLEVINKTITSNKNSFSYIYRVINKDNEIKWVYNRTIIVRDDNGNVKALFGYLNDITQMKLNEEELKLRVKSEVDKNTEKDRLINQQNKLASMGETLGNIAHQWRQPLNNVNLLIHFIRDNYGTFSQEDLNETIESAKLQINYMSKTIDDFKDFYKPSKDKKVFNIEEAIAKSHKIVQAGFEHNNIEFNVSGDYAEVNSYENEFEQVIVNILNNTIDAAILIKEKVEIVPQVNVNIQKAEKITVEISNNCGNVSSEVLEKMFDPYFTTKFENQGTGIGLYMAKVIIEKNMKGKIVANNTSDGVKFVIII
jgi:PAS domain S-box-containing protein